VSARYTLEELSDQREIEELAHRYATGIDTQDYDLIDAIFTPDGIMDYQALGGPRGPWVTEVKTWSKESLAGFPVRKHYITNTVVTYAGDRETATAVSYWRAPMGFEKADGSLHVFESGGRYEDALVRTPDGWRIRERVTLQDWMIGTLPDELAAPL
jgi:hypothetical protein